MSALLLTREELASLTGFRQPCKVLAELHRRGFVRAVLARGNVVLARAHYESVAAGTYGTPTPPEPATAPRFAPPRYEGSALHRFHLAQTEEANARRERNAQAAAEEAARLLEMAPQIAEERRQKRAALVRYHAAPRRALLMQRTPEWADRDAILAIYNQAQRLTDTGVSHHVDHILPLQGRLVSGLHVESNLQIITGSENSRKRNHFEIEP